MDVYLHAVLIMLKVNFFRSFNAIFSKIGRLASEEVVISSIYAKCLPVLLYMGRPGIYWREINVP